MYHLIDGVYTSIWKRVKVVPIPKVNRQKKIEDHACIFDINHLNCLKNFSNFCRKQIQALHTDTKYFGAVKRRSTFDHIDQSISINKLFNLRVYITFLFGWIWSFLQDWHSLVPVSIYFWALHHHVVILGL